MTARAKRDAWVDWLRVLGVGAVFVVHVAAVFNPWAAWHIRSATPVPAIGAVILLFAPWLMPLFMLLAGVTAWHSLGARSTGAVVRERLTWIGLPMVLGVLLLVPPQVYIERRVNGQFSGSFLEFYPHFFEGLYPSGNFSWHHLWFLGHLLVYSLLALPLFRFWQGERGRRQLAWVARACRAPLGLLWLALPLIVERLLYWLLLARHGLLDTDWSGQSILFVAYLYGFALAAEGDLAADVDRSWPAFAAIAAVSTFLLVSAGIDGLIPSRVPPRATVPAMLFWSAYAVGAWAGVLAVVGVARRWLRTAPTWLTRARRGSLWWYLLHQPVIVGVAAWAVTLPFGSLVQASILFAVSAAATLALVALALALSRRSDPVAP